MREFSGVSWASIIYHPLLWAPNFILQEMLRTHTTREVLATPSILQKEKRKPGARRLGFTQSHTAAPRREPNASPASSNPKAQLSPSLPASQTLRICPCSYMICGHYQRNHHSKQNEAYILVFPISSTTLLSSLGSTPAPPQARHLVLGAVALPLSEGAGEVDDVLSQGCVHSYNKT